MSKHKPQNKTITSQTKSPVADARSPIARVIADKWYLITLMALAFIINAQTISYDYALDDAVFTSENSLIGIKGIAAIPALFTHGKNYNFDKSNTGSYRPLLPVSFAIEHHFFGFNPAVSHFINLVFFCLLIMVLFKLLRWIFRDYPVHLPFLVLLLFELHPIHTEVVANVKSRDEILSLLFTALSMIQSFKYIDTNKNKHLILSGLYFFIALLAKESPLCFVAIVPIMLYFFTNAKPMKLLIAGIPYFIMSVVFVIMRTGFLDKPSATSKVQITENFLVAASGFSQKLGTVLWIQLKYLILLIFPHPLSYDYSYNQVPLVGLTDYKALISLVIISGLLIYAVVNFKRKNIFSFCILFYFLSMSITSNLLVEIGATMGERFLFIPSLAFCIAVVFLIAWVAKVDLRTINLTNSTALTFTVFIISLLYGIKTVARNEDWKNNFTLFTSGVETTPNSWRTQDYLGMEYEKMAVADKDPLAMKKDADEAIGLFRKSIDIYPPKADAQADLGAVYLLVNNNDSAIAHLEYAVKLNPKLSSAIANIGMVYLRRVDFPQAVNYFLETVSLDSTNILAEFNLAYGYSQVGKYDSAIYYFKRSMALDPEYSGHKAFDNTAILFSMTGKPDSAKKYEALARERNPAFKL